jgi:hypothetical protein
METIDEEHRSQCNSAECIRHNITAVLPSIVSWGIPLFVFECEVMCPFKINVIRAYMQENSIVNMRIEIRLLQIERDVALLHVKYLRKTVSVLMASEKKNGE